MEFWRPHKCDSPWDATFLRNTDGSRTRVRGVPGGAVCSEARHPPPLPAQGLRAWCRRPGSSTRSPSRVLTATQWRTKRRARGQAAQTPRCGILAAWCGGVAPSPRWPTVRAPCNRGNAGCYRCGGASHARAFRRRRSTRPASQAAHWPEIETPEMSRHAAKMPQADPADTPSEP